jgi:asparaginyl-tRNA synthetase
MEFLRKWLHLRPRTDILSAIFKIRHCIMQLFRTYFNNMDCIEIQTPILTSIDGEGAGELFSIAPTMFDGKLESFFDRQIYLTVSSQLHLEAMASSFKRVYSISPSFRAENTNTSRHLAEFWMLEVEFSFLDKLEDLLKLIESTIQTILQQVVHQCPKELSFLHQFIDTTLYSRLEKIIQTPFIRMTYNEAITCLQNSRQVFSYPVDSKLGLQSEHEKYLASTYSNHIPVLVINYPKHLKPFYMRQNEDGHTVAAVDLLVPQIGELAGGSLREERLTLLEQRMKELNLNPSLYNWYLDLRTYGSTPHGGFGLGIERFLRCITGLQNVRDVIPFPRYVHSCPL